MATWKHRILEVDEQSKTGICQNCGEVPLIRKANRWKCKIAKQEQRGEDKREGSTRKTRFADGHLRPSVVEVAAMLEKQQGLCAICLEGMEVPHIDHCHSTGKIRGLLCRSCNLGLGFFRDSKINLTRAIDYL